MTPYHTTALGQALPGLSSPTGLLPEVGLVLEGSWAVWAERNREKSPEGRTVLG